MIFKTYIFSSYSENQVHVEGVARARAQHTYRILKQYNQELGP